MKRFLAVFLLWTLPLYAAMSDANALKLAKSLWGNLASIGTVRDAVASNWTKQVGVKTTGCIRPFQVLGSGFNTWDAAFMDYNAHPVPIAGPFKGTVNFKFSAWDNVAVAKADLIIDGTPMNAVINMVPAPTWSVSIPVNTSLLANGFHLVCMRAEDSSGNVGLSDARFFNVDQAVAQSPGEWNLQKQPPDGSPSISFPTSIVEVLR